MKKEDITLLEVVWYETFNEETKGFQLPWKDKFYKTSFENGRLPRWNVAFFFYLKYKKAPRGAFFI
jgi:hypothetical protein